MSITINYWVAYAIFLFLNINQGFWGLSLRPYRNKGSLLSMMSSGLPFGFATMFGIAMAIRPPNIENTSSLFIFWLMSTMTAFLVLLIRHFKK